MTMQTPQDGPSFVLVFDASGVLLSATDDLARFCGWDETRLAPGTSRETLLPELRQLAAANPDLHLAVLPQAAGQTCILLTDHRPARLAAETAEAAKHHFAASMSHELRTPLNIVIGFADTLASEGHSLTAPVLHEYATAILDAGRELLGTINAILDMARVDQGRSELRDNTIDIARLFEDCIRQADPAAQSVGVRLRPGRCAADVLLHADERRMRQVIANLISNALIFTPAGGDVTLQADLLPDGQLRLAVTDNGTGIAPDAMARLFQPFTQVNGGLNHRHGGTGTGIGLYVARALVMAHDGTLTIESQQGIGTTATILLPAARLQPRSTLSRALLQETP